MRIGIIYYSNQGNTKATADLLAKHIGAETVEMTENINFDGFFGMLRGMFRFMTGKFDLDTSVLEKANGFDTIVLGSPVWANRVSPAVNKVLKLAELKGKTVYVYTLQADPEHKGHEERKAALKAAVVKAGATFGGCFALVGAGTGKGVAPEADLEKQLKTVVIG